MSLDLTLLPFARPRPDCSYAATMLRCTGSQALFDTLLALEERKGRDVPSDFDTYLSRGKDGPCYGVTTTTPYGEPLRWLTAGSLVWIVGPSIEHEGVVNRAVWAYLATLPEDWPVALYWH